MGKRDRERRELIRLGHKGLSFRERGQDQAASREAAEMDREARGLASKVGGTSGRRFPRRKGR